MGGRYFPLQWLLFAWATAMGREVVGSGPLRGGAAVRVHDESPVALTLSKVNFQVKVLFQSGTKELQGAPSIFTFFVLKH